GRAGIRGRRRERMQPEALRGLGEDHPGLRHYQRLVGIVVVARTLEDVAALDLLAAQVSGLARGAAELLEAIVIRLEIVVGDAPSLDGHVFRDRGASVACGQMAAQHEFARTEPPGNAVPVRAGAADAVAERGHLP